MNTTPMREFNHFPIIEGKVGNLQGVGEQAGRSMEIHE